MTRLVAPVLICLAVILGACETPNPAPAPGRGDPYPPPINDPQITVIPPELRKWIAFHPARIEPSGELGPMKVEIPLRNLTERQYLLEYRITFFDANDMLLDPAMGWQMVSLDPKQTVRLRANSLSHDAENYRVEVRWSM